jgi:hypothetical protein
MALMNEIVYFLIYHQHICVNVYGVCCQEYIPASDWIDISISNVSFISL